jgi:uncharacterized membrane protein YqjE
MSRASTIDLVRRLVNNISGLVDSEIELAKQEAREDISKTLTSAVLLIAGGALLAIGLICIVVAIILALALILPGWASALIWAAFFLLVGGILTLIGKNKLVTRPLKRTRETLREDIEWARGQVKR